MGAPLAAVPHGPLAFVELTGALQLAVLGDGGLTLWDVPAGQLKWRTAVRPVTRGAIAVLQRAGGPRWRRNLPRLGLGPLLVES